MKSKNRRGIFKVVLALTAVGLGTAGTAFATFYCALLDDITIVVGEARASIIDGSDSFYANSYSDNGDEIKLPRDWVIGKVTAVTGSFNMGVAASYHDGALSDCGNVVTEFKLNWDNTDPTLVCDGTDGNLTATWTVNSCNSPFVTADTFQGHREVSLYGLSTSGSIKFDPEVRVKRGGTTQNSDLDGCLSVVTDFCTTAGG